MRELGRFGTALLGILPGALAFVACSEIFPPTHSYSTVVVQTTRPGGEPVPGVGLVLYNPTRHMGYGTTGLGGQYAFNFVPEGIYGVGMVVPSGYIVPDEAPLFVDGLEMGGGVTREVTFTLLRGGSGTVEATVRDEQGAPLEGVWVVLEASGSTIAESRTNTDGSHTFTDVATGTYAVRVDEYWGGPLGAQRVEGILIDDGADRQAVLTVERCEGTVQVEVADTTAVPVPDVPLLLYTARGAEANATTAVDGTHAFGVWCGEEYGVRMEVDESRLPAAEPGYLDGIQVNEAETASAVFTLAR